MGRIFEKADDYTDFNGKSFNDVVEAAKAKAPGITWEELAMFNWATKDPREVNRALMETIGCKTMDAGNPSNTQFATRFGPGNFAKIRLPKLWTNPLTEGKDHVVQLKKKKPFPAIAITKLTRWFEPQKPGKKGTFEAEYSLEGIRERADKVDFEVHTDHYTEEVLDSSGEKTGTTKPSDTQAEAGSTHIKQDRVIFTVPGVRAPTDKKPYNKWKGESEATKGVLAKTGASDVYIDYSCAPYTVLFRFYKSDADKDAKITLNCFCPTWTAPKVKGGQWVLDDSSINMVKWKVSGDNGKLTMGQLLVWDKDDNEVLRYALSKYEIQAGETYLHRKWDKSAIKRELMPYRIQVQAHSDADEDDGLAIAVMQTGVKAMQYDQVQFIAFHVKPGKSSTNQYLGDADDDDDIRNRCGIMIDAIKAAEGAGVNESEKVLKLFMAPEFYFRGARGAYNLTKVPPIIDKMLVETGKFQYADWLFVYGTAIGEIAHEGSGGNMKQYGGPIGDIDGLFEYQKHPIKLKNLSHVGSTFRLVPNPKNPAHMSASINYGNVGWKIVQQAKETVVATGQEIMRTRLIADIVSSGSDTIKLKNPTTFDSDPNLALFLLEPSVWILSSVAGGGQTAVRLRSPFAPRINVGAGAWSLWQDQGGYVGNGIVSITPAGKDWDLIVHGDQPFTPGLALLQEPLASEIINTALVQKGWPSQCCKRQLKRAVIFKETISGLDFNSSAGGTIEIEGQDRSMLYAEGATGGFGRNPNPQGAGKRWHSRDGSSHTVGSEINVSGEGGSSVITIDDIVFGIEVCLDHGINRLGKFYHNAAQSRDPRVQVHLIPSWGMSIGLDEGEPCTVDEGLVFNVDGLRGDSQVRFQDGTTYACGDHRPSDEAGPGYCKVVIKDYYCVPCAKWLPGPGSCSNGHPPTPLTECRFCANPADCPGIWDPADTQCPDCGFARPKCGIALKILGAERISIATVPVPSSHSPTHFIGTGSVVVYDVEALPGPELVP